MAKTPSELRLELLQLARDILNEKYGSMNLSDENDWFVLRERYSADNLAKIPSFPRKKYATEEEVVEVAKKMNEFVSNG